MFSRLSTRPLNRLFSTSMDKSDFKSAATDFLNFVNASPTPFHAVKCAKEKLTEAGFKEIKVRHGL
jgi:aspartyl aminopeptidase